MSLQKTYGKVNERFFERPISVRESIAFSTEHNLLEDIAGHVVKSARRLRLDDDSVAAVSIADLCTVSGNVVTVAGLFDEDETRVEGIYSAQIVLGLADVVGEPEDAEELNIIFEMVS